MFLTFKKNMLLLNALFFLGYANSLQAGECGVLHYLANKSNGVAITGNTCKTVDDIALGSEFNLMPGARLWFKSQLNADAKKVQGICQSRSPKSIRIGVDSDKLPWIKPDGLTHCASWMNNKMNCDDAKGGPNALSCVIAMVDSEPRPKGLEERTTSVRMRALPMLGESGKNESAQDAAETENERIMSAMQPDIDLCKALSRSDAPIKISWQVQTNGRVNTVIPAADAQNDTDNLLIECLSAVIKDFTYPQSAQAIWLSNQF